jgi:cytochrome c oxidase subunit 2
MLLMKKVKRSAVIFVGTALALSLGACGKSTGTTADISSASPSPSSSTSPEATSPAAGEQTVQVEASNFDWKLDKTTFAAGKPIHFKVTAKEGVHGFSIVGTNVSVPVMAGKTEDVTWTPDKPGEYTIKCNHYCGAGHSTMSVQITVT